MVVGNDIDYAPGRTHPALIHDLPSADLVQRIDLRAVFDHFGPMLDMLVTMALAPPAPRDAAPDSVGGAAGPSTPAAGLSSAQVDEVLAMVDTVRDGIRTVEFAVNVDGVRVELHAGVDVDPEGPLALGEQPAREAAIELLRRLPDEIGTAGYAAVALDLHRMTDLLEQFAGLAAQLTPTAPAGGLPADTFYAQLT